MNSDLCKVFKKILLGQKIENQTKIATHMDIGKYG